MRLDDQSTSHGIALGVEPWPSEWVGSKSPRYPCTSEQAHLKYLRLRIKRIGFAASSGAAAVWLLAMLWVWPILT